MGSKRVAASVIVGMGMGLAVGMSSGAWACTRTSDPFLATMLPNQAVSGSTATITGGQWKADADLPIQLVWKATGERLATVTGPDFSARIRVPDAAAGVYYVEAFQAGVEKATPFQVQVASTGEGSVTGPAEASSLSIGGVGSASPGVPGGEPSPLAPAPTGPTAGGLAGTPGLPGPTPNGGGVMPVVPGGTLATVAPKEQATAGVPQVGATSGSERSSDDDLWSGLRQGLTGHPVLGMLDVDRAPATGRSPMMVGIWLLAVGVVTAFTGFAGGELRRRRATVQL